MLIAATVKGRRTLWSGEDSIEELARLRRMKDEERRRVQAERRHSRSDAECLRAADRDAGEGKAEQ